MKKLLVATSLCIASISASAALIVPKYDVAAGQKIVENNCAACHGMTGVSVVPTQPNLGGQNVRYLFKQLRDFKTGYRVNGIMQAQISALSEQDLANVAGYFSQQKPWGAFAGNPATAAEGSKLFLGGDKKRGVIACAGCHDPKGLGNGYAGFPRIGGQHPEYLGIQLKAFRAAGREDDVTRDQKRINDSAKEGDKGMMQVVASRLSDRDIKVLSQFIGAVH
ncbi:cytochrome c4 [Psychrobacter sp. YP14]|uniref:C-type cytochrome n=3 Tax=Psychrobacter TaxID=497 RepID=A0A844M257_9GAMM|nr:MULTISPECIES: c-type cytochrome [Psychrobacter]AWT49609.1 cytochrome c4 [Psychrobacter sp. YP14]MUG33031.1 c-type cytochrome [Psychrobacter sanguinis]UNK04980.1 cytochrome c4 [Psychrobacter sp. PraFG1]